MNSMVLGMEEQMGAVIVYDIAVFTESYECN